MGLSLFLIRHEDAEQGPQLPDAHRGLTAAGRHRMRATAALFAQHDGVDVIFTSPLVRAVQTTEILAAGLAHDAPIHARNVIAEPHSVEAFLSVLDELTASERRVAIVGHEPTLSSIASHVLGTRFRSFSKGMVLALDYDADSGRATFRYMIDGSGPTYLTAP